MKKYKIVLWWNELVAYFHDYPVWLVEFLLASFIGFLFGFIVKNFGKYIVFGLATCFFAAYILEHFSLALFHYDAIKEALGLSNLVVGEGTFSGLSTMIIENYVICLGGVLGCIVGWKVS